MELTLDAAAHIDEYRRRLNLPDSCGLRIDITDDATGFRTAFTQGPEPDDEIVSFWGTQVYVAPALVDALDDLVLAVDEQTDPVRLVLRAGHTLYA
jgi:hypothetical protein